MLNADCAPYFHSCPRCGIGGFEKLRTHSHCVNCNYTEFSGSDEMLAVPQWALDALKTVKPKSLVNELLSESEEETYGFAMAL